VKKALKTKAERGNCACKKGDVLCHTICGTLLGSEAKDYPRGSKRASPEQSASHK